MSENDLRLTRETVIDAATHQRRARAASQLDALPDEAFTRLQYLQPQVGCVNRCALCSQQAGMDVWQLSATGLADLVAAIAHVAGRRGLRLAGERHAHRPGVLFPYLDNDIAGYRHLEALAGYCADDLCVRLRLSTVGFSRHNQYLAGMHERIVAEHSSVIDGIRFSLTPYAVGYRTNRDEYLADLAAALRTWRPYIDRVGPGAATAAVELRFPPLAHAVGGPLHDEIVDGRHIICSPPHLLVSAQPVTGRPRPTTIVGLNGTESVLSRPGEPYLHLISDAILADTDPDKAARLALDGLLIGVHRIRHALVHAWENADGLYYAVDPTFTLDGRYRALHLYPQAGGRRRSGYTDASRYFLNALLAHKTACGIGRRAPFPHATYGDVRAVLDRLAGRSAQLSSTDRRAAAHITTQVLPLVQALAEVLAAAGYPPSAFFDRRFTIDTGQIVNQGNARPLFRGLAGTLDEPMTPREERGYGDLSLSSVRGTVWRIAPSPVNAGQLYRVGGKNTSRPAPTIVVEELDPQHLRPVDRATGEPLRRYTLTGVDTETVPIADADRLLAFPGATA
jgi:hypothetical protein